LSLKFNGANTGFHGTLSFDLVLVVVMLPVVLLSTLVLKNSIKVKKAYLVYNKVEKNSIGIRTAFLDRRYKRSILPVVQNAIEGET
jgi:hypothetical protein